MCEEEQAQHDVVYRVPNIACSSCSWGVVCIGSLMVAGSMRWVRLVVGKHQVLCMLSDWCDKKVSYFNTWQVIMIPLCPHFFIL